MHSKTTVIVRGDHIQAGRVKPSSATSAWKPGNFSEAFGGRLLNWTADSKKFDASG